MGRSEAHSVCGPERPHAMRSRNPLAHKGFSTRRKVETASPNFPPAYSTLTLRMHPSTTPMHPKRTARAHRA